MCVHVSPLTRWIKFEEKVEKGGERWSKPHVATLSLHSLFELKTCIEKGTIRLDLEANSLQQIVGKKHNQTTPQILAALSTIVFLQIFIYCSLSLPLFLFLSEMITDSQIESGLLKPDVKEKVMFTLLRKHRHQTKKSNLRSLADIGKTVSSASRLFSNQENGNAGLVLFYNALTSIHFLTFSIFLALSFFLSVRAFAPLIQLFL